MYLLINTSDIFEPSDITTTYYDTTTYYHTAPPKRDETLEIVSMLGISSLLMFALCAYTITMQIRKDRDFQDLKRNVARVHAVDKRNTQKLNKLLGLTPQQGGPTDDELIDALGDLQPVSRMDSTVFDYAVLATPSVSAITPLSTAIGTGKIRSAGSVFMSSPSIMPPLPSNEEVHLDLNGHDAKNDDDVYHELNTPSDVEPEDKVKLYVPSKVKDEKKEKDAETYNAVPLKGSSEEEVSDADLVHHEVENVLLNDWLML